VLVRHQDEIESTVIVEIRNAQHSCIGRSVGVCNLARNFPPCSVVFIGRTHDAAVVLYDCQIQNAVVVDIENIQRGRWRGEWYPSFGKLPLPLVAENPQSIRAVDQCGIRIAVGVDVCPGKIQESTDAGKRMNLEESAVAVITQNGGQRLIDSEN